MLDADVPAVVRRSVIAGERAVESCPLQQHDCFGVSYLAVGDHRHRFAEGQFEHFNVLAVLGQPSAAGRSVCRRVGGGVEVQSLGD